MTTLYKLSIHSQSLEMRGIFLVSRYVGTINQLSVRQKFFCWFSLVFQKESAIQLSKPILQHLQGGPLFMNHPVLRLKSLIFSYYDWFCWEIPNWRLLYHFFKGVVKIKGRLLQQRNKQHFSNLNSPKVFHYGA